MLKKFSILFSTPEFFIYILLHKTHDISSIDVTRSLSYKHKRWALSPRVFSFLCLFFARKQVILARILKFLLHNTFSFKIVGFMFRKPWRFKSISPYIGLTQSPVQKWSRFYILPVCIRLWFKHKTHKLTCKIANLKSLTGYHWKKK